MRVATRRAILGAMYVTLFLALVVAGAAQAAPERQLPAAPGRLLSAVPGRLLSAVPGRLLSAAPGLDPVVLEAALARAACARAEGALPADAPPVLAVIDYSLPSTDARLWVFDLEAGALLFHERVAHGQGTGEDLAVAFSNRPNSHQSSLGLFRGGEVYTGQHGTSLRLYGLDPGVNDRAAERAIVVHGAPYVSEDFITRNGRLGRSWGCPAVSTEVAPALVQTLAGGAVLYAWHPSMGAPVACRG